MGTENNGEDKYPYKTYQIMDLSTGEVVHTYYRHVENGIIKKFWKCYLDELLKVLFVLEGKQIKVFSCLCENIDSWKNTISPSKITYAKIQKKADVSQPTIAATIKKLKQADFMRKNADGEWFVNPKILVKGKDSRRDTLLVEYYTLEK